MLPPECDPAKHNLEEQIEFQKKQIAELVEKYPDVFYIWNDALDDKIMPAEEAQAFIRSLGPDILASSNWWDWGKKGHAVRRHRGQGSAAFPGDQHGPGRDLLEAGTEVVLERGVPRRQRQGRHGSHGQGACQELELPAQCRPGQEGAGSSNPASRPWRKSGNYGKNQMNEQAPVDQMKANKAMEATS